jgi:hypothetical protein
MSSMMPASAAVDPARGAGSIASRMDQPAIAGVDGGHVGEPAGPSGRDADALIAAAPKRPGRQPGMRG